jgi:Ni,Fe-hydrogenase III large subunit
MPSVYEMEHSKEVAYVLEQMRQKVGKEFGVTLVGNRLTVRWNMDGQLVDAHMIIESVTTPTEAADGMAKHERYEKLFEKYKKKFPGLAGELYYAENGEWQK